MSRTSFLVASVLGITILGCVSYDQPQIYHKNFQPGTHPLLRFDGYYTSTFEAKMTERAKPLYFYRDGSVWCGESLIHMNSVDSLIRKGTPHSWGNYKIDEDTITVERFFQEENTGNYNRIILRGVIQKDNIHWLTRRFHDGKGDSVNYDMKFIPHSFKPDSTLNWTRTRKQFNK